MYSYLDKHNRIIASDQEITEENLVAIDENIAYAIQRLNELGYATAYSCEGHFGNVINVCSTDEETGEVVSKQLKMEHIATTYITFDNGIKLPSVPDGWAKEISETSYDENNNLIKGYWETIRFEPEMNDLNTLRFYLYKFKALTNLYNWVNELNNLRGNA